jgi:hypothetical protein
MAQYAFAPNRDTEIVLLALQAFQVLFLWIHDWIPLGRLNDIAAVRSQDTTRRLVLVTLIQSVPFTVGLVFSPLNFARHYPHWLYNWALDQLWLALRRTDPCLVDTLSPSRGAETGRSLSGRVRKHTLLLATAQRTCPEHRAYPASSVDCLYIGDSSHTVKSA